MNEYEVVVGIYLCITPPMRNEEEAHTYAMGWYATKYQKVGTVASVRLFRRGVVPHNLSSGTSEA